MLDFNKFIGLNVNVSERKILLETGAEVIEKNFEVNDPTIMSLKESFPNLAICVMTQGMARTMQIQPDVLFVWLTSDFKINSITMDN